MVRVRGSGVGVVAAVHWEGHEQRMPVPQLPALACGQRLHLRALSITMLGTASCPNMYNRRFHEECVLYELM